MAPSPLSPDDPTYHETETDELLEKGRGDAFRGFRAPTPPLKRTACLVLLAVALSALVASGIGLAIGRAAAPTAPSSANPLTAPFQPTPRLRHCGTSTDEARSLGCRFQIWSYSWVPPECYDGQLVDEWMAMRDWEYFDQRYDRGRLVNFSDVLAGEGDRVLYSTWGQHYWHCAFTWRKFLRAALGSGVGITDGDLDLHHANHCQDTIRNKPDFRPWDENDIELKVGFHRC